MSECRGAAASGLRREDRGTREERRGKTAHSGAPEGAGDTVLSALDRLSLNQATVKRLGVPEAVDLCVRHEIPAIGLWREPVAETGLDAAAAAVRDAGLRVSSLCRGGFFTHADPEALHPVFAADRCVITRLGEALDLALQFPADAVGVVVDTYHLWWDAALLPDVARAGERIASYQVCDWILPLPADTLLGRGHVGDGYIDFPPVTAAVAAAGYAGDIEVEIFNEAIWSAPPDETAATVRKRFPLAF